MLLQFGRKPFEVRRKDFETRDLVEAPVGTRGRRVIAKSKSGYHAYFEKGANRIQAAELARSKFKFDDVSFVIVIDDNGVIDYIDLRTCKTTTSEQLEIMVSGAIDACRGKSPTHVIMPGAAADSTVPGPEGAGAVDLTAPLEEMQYDEEGDAQPSLEQQQFELKKRDDEFRQKFNVLNKEQELRIAELSGDELADYYAIIEAAVRSNLSKPETPSQPKPSIYDERRPGETILDFVKRRYPDYQPYRDAWKDGDIVAFIANRFGQRGFLDGRLFTRAVLRNLDGKAGRALDNWLAKPGNQLPANTPVPNRVAMSEVIVADLDPHIVRAVLTADGLRRQRKREPK